MLFAISLMAWQLHSTQMTTRRFHSACYGNNISLSDNNTVARRVGNFWCNSIVFTEQPVALGTVFQVKILEYDDDCIMAGSIVSG